MGDPDNPGDPLYAVLEAHASADAFAWLLARSRTLPELFTGARRRFGPSCPSLTESEREQLQAAGAVDPSCFSLTDLARAWVLRRATVEGMTDLLRKGDNGERISLLRALPLMPDADRFTELAIDACRTHVLDVFAAIACENAFPARYFPEPNFNQLAIKTLFVELSLERVHGWRSRVNPELVRMAGDYEAERRAAGRVVPADVALIRGAQAQTHTESSP